MPLMTRCTHCSTVFRIAPEQLQTHGGQVRCGRCMQVFDGLAALVADAAPGTATAPAQAGSAAVSLTAADKTPAAVEPVSASPAPDVPPSMPEPVAAAAEGVTVEPEVVVPSAAASVEVPAAIGHEAPLAATEPESVPEPEMPVSAAPESDNPFIDVPDVHGESEHRRSPWLAVAIVLLSVALAAQAVYFYRGEIAARHPLARQWLTELCARSGCTVSLPQAPQSVLIEASDLQAVDPSRPGRIQLTATLRNHAGHEVGYPALDLVLTNANDHALARRIFLPPEYLGRGRDPQAGIAANAELTVRLALDTGNLGASGFRLAVLPAPQH